MGQSAVHDQVADRYAEDVEHLRAAWEAAARGTEPLLGGTLIRHALDGDQIAARLRTTQYHAHLSAEVGSGMVPPPGADTAHITLLDSLAACRETLGVLAVRADLDELDDDTADFGMQAMDLVRDAFQDIQRLPLVLHPWERRDTSEGTQWNSAGGASRMAFLSGMVWTLVAVCSAIFVAILLELVVLKS